MDLSPLLDVSDGIKFQMSKVEHAEDELTAEQPGLSLPLETNSPNDDSFDAPPPRLSVLIGDEEYTMRSIEVPRGEPQRSNFSRESFEHTRELDHSGYVGTPGQEEALLLGDDDSVIRPVIGAGAEGDSRLTHRMELGGNTKDLWQSLSGIAAQENNLFTGAESGQLVHANAFLPFVLDIPNIDPIHCHRDSLGPPAALHNGSSEVAGTCKFPDIETLQPEYLTSPANLKTRTRPFRVPSASEKTKEHIVRKRRKSNLLKLSYHGIAYAPVPHGIYKKIATTYAGELGNRRCRLNKDTLNEIIDAGALFFEQLSADLKMFAKQAGRKTINETDVVAVIDR
ncbi:MAG: hypothetical protein Q9163_004669 [Psora crenata]